MKKIIYFLLILFFPSIGISETSLVNHKDYFYVGKMDSYHKKFTLYFKTREKAILAKGEHTNYITDYPQDLYLFDHITNQDEPIISYDWFPKKIKKISKFYEYPMFPEDFAYYLLNDNNTLVLVSAQKKFFQNLKYDIRNKILSIEDNKSKLEFIVSSLAKNCGFPSLKEKLECRLYKPLISSNLINSIE